MRKPILLILTNAFLLIAIIGLLAQSLLVVQRVAQVRSLKGKVEVQRGGNGSFLPLGAGEPVKVGDIIRTGPSSTAEFSWLDGTRWKILGNSQFSIEKASFSSSKKIEISQLDLESGEVLVRISKNLPASSSFEVKTPTSLVVSHGKIFSVEFNEGFSAVEVYKGSASISGNSDGQTTVLSPEKRGVETALGWQVRPVTDRSTFLSEPDFTQPLLEVSAKKMENGFVMVNGQSEADSTVRVDGTPVPVLGNGLFFKKVKARVGLNSWNVETIDPFGETNSVVKALNVTPDCSDEAQAQKGK